MNLRTNNSRKLPNCQGNKQEWEWNAPEMHDKLDKKLFNSLDNLVQE